MIELSGNVISVCKKGEKDRLGIVEDMELWKMQDAGCGNEKKQQEVEESMDSKEQAIDALKRAGDDWSEKLWKCIITFENDVFTTSGRSNRPGIPFTYIVTRTAGAGGRHYHGAVVPGYGNEIKIVGKTKSISRSTVELAFQRVQEMEGIVKGPRSLGIPGAGSYLYSLFMRFGLIRVS